MVMINKEMSAKVIKALNEKKQVDEKGKQNIADLDYNNEIMIMQARNIATAQVMTVMVGGGQGKSVPAQIEECTVGVYDGEFYQSCS